MKSKGTGSPSPVPSSRHQDTNWAPAACISSNIYDTVNKTGSYRILLGLIKYLENKSRLITILFEVQDETRERRKRMVKVALDISFGAVMLCSIVKSHHA